jgi:RNA polymerase sigma factor (sigma-70 family)
MSEQEVGRNPVFAAPGSNDYRGLIASSTNNKGRSKAHEFQGLPEKEANDFCLQFDRLVCKMAHRYRGKGIEFDELKAAGQLGLVEASRKFDCNRGIPFGGYAQHWIAGAIKDLFKAGKYAPDFQRKESLNAALPNDGKESPDKLKPLADALAEEPPSVALDLRVLSETDRQIIEARSAGETLSEIGKAHGLSAERVRQREAHALKQIKGAVASACIGDLVERGKVIRSPGRNYARTEPGFRDRPPPRHAYHKPQPSKEILRHRLNATRLSAMRGGSDPFDWGRK